MFYNLCSEAQHSNVTVQSRHVLIQTSSRGDVGDQSVGSAALYPKRRLHFHPPVENHILEDVNKCVIALQEGDVDTLDRTAGAIRGRAARVVHIINAEMENYEPGVYTERVLESIKLLSETG